VADVESVKLYFDYKSPFAWLASQLAWELPERWRIELRWIPYVLRIKGPGQRSVHSDWKAKYSYLDARRTANARGGFPIRGPRKIYDSRPALVGGLFAQREGLFRRYSEETWARFFDHRLEIDEPAAVAALLAELGADPEAYRAYLAGEGAAALEACLAEGEADQVFGVPLFLLRGEPFWGNDRVPLLEQRLAEYGLRRRPG
jgi:2-hydroxychromene-2-carboxylate isomerase